MDAHQLKRGVGIAVGRIQVDILDAVINKAYPDLDDLIRPRNGLVEDIEG